VRRRAPLLYLTVLVIATSGLVYELVAGTLASYVLGDSVTQFSTTIGVYLFAMGIGSFLTRYIDDDVATRFIEIELAAAVIGGFSAAFLFVGFAYSTFFPVLLYGTIVVIGTLVGMEIPLLMRILRDHLDFKELVARVLSVDYLGALAGSLLFALVLVPTVGLNRTSILFGLLNAVVAMMTTFILHDLLPRRTRIRLRIKSAVAAALLVAGWIYSEELTQFGEESFYADPIVYTQQTPYQRIVLTQGRNSVQLFLNGNLQFSSSDEYRYHEALVHPAFASTPDHRRVLVLGGGDGLALREVYRYPDVESVTLVDLDPGVTDIATRLPTLARLNEDAMVDPRTHLVHDDAMVWLDELRSPDPFDIVLIDFPDPSNYSLGKLYTRRFYRLVQKVMDDDTALVVQSTSPLYARRSFWCIERTMAEAGLVTRPFHVTVPSFGVWGFILAKKQTFETPTELAMEAGSLRYLTDETLASLFVFGTDIAPVPVETNRLNTQRLVEYYEEEWGVWN
jgi:spermidine synthase